MNILLFLIFVVFSAFNAVNAFTPFASLNINIKLKNNYRKLKMISMNFEDNFDKFFEDNFEKNYDELVSKYENNKKEYKEESNKCVNPIKEIYTVIWNISLQSEFLLNDIGLHNLNYKFYEKNSFTKKRFDKIYEKHIKDTAFSESKGPFIFKNEQFIGGIFELYEQIFYNN
jgi:hypothetical protein